MKYYAIINIQDITQDMINESLNKANTMRRSIDGKKAVLKFKTEFPNTMKGHVLYPEKKIRELLDTTEWRDPTTLAEKVASFFK